MSKYPAYKESGVEWIGEIPENWVVKKLKFFARILNGRDYQENVVEEGGYPVYGSGGQFARSSKYLHDKPSVLLGRKGTVDKPQIVFTPFWTADTTYYTDIFDNVHPKYLFHLVNQIQFDLYIYGSAIPSMTKSVYDDMLFCYPPLHEQQAIVTYLDNQTALIDDLVRKKEEKIQLLKEQRTSLINHVVTKGLDPDVEMKDSGVVEIGTIPNHWKTIKLKFIAHLQSGCSITSDSIDVEGKYPVYGGNGLRGYTSTYTHEGYHALIGRQGALCGNINYAKGKFWASEHAVVVTLRGNYDTHWLGELLKVMNLNQYSLASAQPGLSVERIQNLDIPVPPSNEQVLISNYMKEQTDFIDTTIQQEKQKIELLKEYRQSLISNVVTGKVCVIDD
ncbi:restriction endonuclease subunit S [Telluribacter humicola]|uniref:restriction endonuclease subunit S n=1 Tax=Telluribacter humicola TaxID=1720261 RepID=UPI001A969915|nr:restriction endonuclease subunit S [Telluribacter humicola]